MDWPTEDEIANIVRGAQGWDAPRTIAKAILARLAPLRADVEQRDVEWERVMKRELAPIGELLMITIPLARAALAYVDAEDGHRAREYDELEREVIAYRAHSGGA